VDEISEDVEEISGDIDKIQEKDEQETVVESGTRKAIEKIERDLGTLLKDIETLKQSHHSSASHGVDKISGSV